MTDLHLSHADPEITFVELIRDVPAERTEVSSLLHQTVEEAKTKQHLLPSLFLRTTTASTVSLFTRFLKSRSLYAAIDVDRITRLIRPSFQFVRLSVCLYGLAHNSPNLCELSPE